MKKLTLFALTCALSVFCLAGCATSHTVEHDGISWEVQNSWKEAGPTNSDRGVGYVYVAKDYAIDLHFLNYENHDSIIDSAKTTESAYTILRDPAQTYDWTYLDSGKQEGATYELISEELTIDGETTYKTIYDLVIDTYPPTYLRIEVRSNEHETEDEMAEFMETFKFE